MMMKAKSLPSSLPLLTLVSYLTLKLMLTTDDGT